MYSDETESEEEYYYESDDGDDNEIMCTNMDPQLANLLGITLGTEQSQEKSSKKWIHPSTYGLSNSNRIINNQHSNEIYEKNNTIARMKTILIAGGCGFIGSNLCIHLLNDHKIICVDNLYSGKIENVKSCFEHDHFQFINHNIIDPLDLDCEIDEIYHLACPASPPTYQKDPVYTLKTNFIGTMNLLELAKKKSAKILLASTSEIYGEPQLSPQSESYRGNVNTIGIRSCYDEGKRIAETLFMDYHKQYNIETRIVRIFNTYGPRMDRHDGRVVTNFIRQILDNEPITLYGDGSQTRSFQYIDDLLDGLVKLMDTHYNYPINIGNPNEITVKQLASILIEITDSTTNLVYKPLPLDDPTNRNPDISLAKNILNWEPRIDLKTGLLKTIHHLQNS